jgi:steroid delta-isomerase-like uncharacterized protein
MSDQNKMMTRRIIEEVFTHGRYEALNEIIAPQFVTHDPAIPMDGKGPNVVRGVAEMMRTAFPDLRMMVEDQVAERDRVMTRWTARGTHRGPFMGKSATNRAVKISGVTVDRFENGKIVEAWINWDSAGLMQQLGIRVEDSQRSATGDGGRPLQTR